MRDTKPEMTGFRDEEISRRHRKWGHDCPACDCDFILVEYDKLTPVAIIEYKHHGWKDNQFNANIEVIGRLATMAGIYAFVVIYPTPPKSDYPYMFWIYPENQKAKNLTTTRFNTWIEESEFVDFLYSIRGQETPPDIDLFLQSLKPIK